MKSNILILIVALTLIIVLGMTFFLLNPSHSDAISVEVHKSAFIPDQYELDRDSLLYGGFRICSMAQRYYYKDSRFFGGGNSFVGFAIPKSMYETSYGYYILKVKNDKVKVIGKGKLLGYDEINPMEVHFVVNPKMIEETSIIN